MRFGSAPAASYSSARRQAAIDPPKPDPTMQTSTRSAKAAPPGSLARELPAVGEVPVAARRRARQAHHAIPGGGRRRGIPLGGGGAEGGERDRGSGLPERAV